MNYTIYKITNLVNGKVYIGKHMTYDLNDGYMGSGKLLTRAIQKHGRGSFSKEILFVFESEDEMNAKEKELVDEQFVLREDTYNLCVGGNGGFSYINQNVMVGERRREHNQSISIFKHRSDKYPYIEWSRLGGKTSVALKTGMFADGFVNGFLGKNHTEESKRKISDSKRGTGVGDENPQKREDVRKKISEQLKRRGVVPPSSKGRKCVTDGVLNKKALPEQLEEYIQKGWWLGRS